MKITYEEFNAMELRPAYYNGTQFEIDIDFRKVSPHRVGIEVSKAINAVVGDTVRISGKVFIENSDFINIDVYMCGDVLSDFIEKYGSGRITETIKMKLERVYAVYECNDYSFEPNKEEIAAYKLIEIIDE